MGAVKATVKLTLASEETMAEPQDITAAKGTYEGFLTFFKWGAIASAIVTGFVVLLIAN